MKITSGILFAVLTVFAGSAALAQTAAPVKPAVAAPVATPVEVAKPSAKKPAMNDDAKAAKSKECSAEADAKKLHGKERKKFRDECKKAG